MLTPHVNQFLDKIVAGVKFPHTASANPLENSYWKYLINIAVDGLEVVARGSLDMKLTAIVKLLQAWIEQKEADQAEAEYQESWKFRVM